MAITRFTRRHSFLSNFSPARIDMYGTVYPTVEHAYQAMKTLDIRERGQILIAPTPTVAKRIGGSVTLRSDWDTIRVSIMTELIFQKFCTDPRWTKMLLGTKDEELIEGNYWHDNFWGKCRCPRCRHTEQINMLGRILMDTRTLLAGEKA